MAFGGLAGLTPDEFLRRFGVTTQRLPFGSGLGAGATDLPYAIPSSLTGPALPGLNLDPMEVMNNRGYWQLRGQPNPWDAAVRGRSNVIPGAESVASPIRQGGGIAAETAAPLSRSHTAAQRVLQSLQGSAGTEPIPMGAGTLPQRVPGATVESFGRNLRGPNAIPENFWLQQVRGPGGQMMPRVPAPNVVGPTSPATAGPWSPAGITRNGPNLGAVPEGVVNSVDDAVREAITRGPSEVPVTIRSAAQAAAGPAAEGAVTNALVHVPGMGSGPGLNGAAAAAESAPGFFARNFPTLAGMGSRETPGLLGRIGGFATRPGMLAGLGRGIAGGVADNLVFQPAADAIGDNPLGHFVSGFGHGAGIGFVGGPIPGLIGGLGAGLGNTVSEALLGRGLDSIEIAGFRPFGEAEQPSPFDQAVSQVQDSGQPGSQEMVNLMSSLRDLSMGNGDAAAVRDQYGLTPEQWSEVTSTFNAMPADASQEDRTAALAEMAGNILTSQATNEQQAQFDQMSGGGLSGSDIVAAQALASQFMAPIAADEVAVGNMARTGLQNLAAGLPAGLAGPINDLANIRGESGQQMANAYMQQAYADPQIYAQQQQLAIRDQIANQLMSQAIGSLPQFAQSSGGGSLEDLLAGAGGNTGIDPATLQALIGG